MLPAVHLLGNEEVVLLQSKQPYFFIESRSTNGNEPAVDAHSNTEPPSSWLKVDPEIEYPTEIHFNQPAQKWKCVNSIQ